MVCRFFLKSAKNMDPLTMATITNAGTTGLGLLLQGHNDKRQIRQQEKLNKLALETDKKKMTFQNDLALQLWKDTNYKAQVQQMKEGGLSPGLIYGLSGGGGTTTGPSGGGVNAPGAPTGGGEIMGLQMIEAQKKLMEAQANKAEAEAEKIAGADTEESRKRIESLTQGIENQKAIEKMTRIQTGVEEVELLIKEGSYKDVIETIGYTARQAEKQLGILSNENEISDKTKDEKIKLVQGELIGLGLANEMKKEGIKLTEEQIKKTVADVAQGWESLNIQKRNSIANMISAEATKKNSETNVRAYLEDVRQNDYGIEVKNGALELQKLISDVRDSQKMTVGAMSNIFTSILRNKRR